MLTVENHPRYSRDKLRYPSDLTGEEWVHVEPLIPLAKPGGGKRRVDMREVVNAVIYSAHLDAERLLHAEHRSRR